MSTYIDTSCSYRGEKKTDIAGNGEAGQPEIGRKVNTLIIEAET